MESVEITVGQQSIREALRGVTRVAGGTSAVRVATHHAQVRLAGATSAVAIDLWIDAHALRQGEVAVPAQPFPAGPIKLTAADGDSAVRIETASCRAAIRKVESDRHPVTAGAGAQAMATIDTTTLKEMVDQVLFACATDDSRPALKGVLANFSGTALTFVTTEGIRLAMRRAELACDANKDLDITIPATVLAHAVRIIPPAEEHVEILVTPALNHVVFRTPRTRFVSALIAGPFVEYHGAIPSTLATTAVVSTSALLEAARTASVFSHSDWSSISIDIWPNSNPDHHCVVIRGEDPEVGEDEVVVKASIIGPAVSVQCQARYLVEALRSMRSSEMVVGVNDPRSAILFKPSDSSHYVSILMPICQEPSLLTTCIRTR